MLTPPALSSGVRSVPVRRRGDQLERDLVVVEEPLEIHVDGKPLVVTMRTPGHDAELAAGFLFGEGVLCDAADIASVHVRAGSGQRATQIRVANFSGDAVDVTLKEGAATPNIAHAEREFRATAACGVCGKTEIGDLDADLPVIVPVEVDRNLLETLPDTPDTLKNSALRYHGHHRADAQPLVHRGARDVGGAVRDVWPPRAHPFRVL